MSVELHILILSCGYKRVSSYIPCSHLRDAASGKVRSWWITCVGLRAGRFEELDYERGSS